MIQVTGKRNILLNVLLWVALYVFWIFVFQNATITVSRTMQIEFCYLVFIAANFYFHLYVAIPRYLNTKKYGVFLLVSIIVLLGTTWLRAEVVLFINEILYNIHPSQINFGNLYFNSLLNIFFWSLCLIAAATVVDRIRYQQYTLLVEKEKVKNELDFLRAQNNPHFLFNALNSVYFQIDKSNKDARGSLMRLSEILRYQLYYCNTEQVPIDKEIIFLENYIELQKLRLNSNYNVVVNIGKDVNGFMIAPMLIMPLVENAFKYVSHYADSINQIEIILNYEGGALVCEVVNSIDNTAAGQSTENSGIGLKNLRRRLDLLYPESYKMNINSDHQKFEVKLILNINEYQVHNSR